jgi:hypothetical protein
MQEFATAGFQEGAFIGISFSIAAPVQRFEEVFKVDFEKDGYPYAATELPLSALKPSLHDNIKAVLFTRPPDFGPSGHF